MKDIVQSIVASRDARASEIDGLKSEVRQLKKEASGMVGAFKASRDEIGAQLKKELAQDKASRESDVNGMLKGFQSSRVKSSANLHKELAHVAAKRRSGVGKILGNAKRDVTDFRSRREESGGKLREELAQSRSSRESEVGELLNVTENLVTGLRESRQATGKKLRRDLAKGKADRDSVVTGMRSDFSKSQAKVRSELNQASAAWQGIAGGGKKTAVKANGKNGKKAAPAEEGTFDLETTLLEAVRNHPEGITLTEVAESMGVNTVVLGHASRKLRDEDKIRKEDKAYFPIIGE